MAIRLIEALLEILADWQSDLPGPWREAIGDTRLGFDACDPSLTLEPWEPVFPVRRGKTFPGAPPGAHIFRAFDAIDPGDVRCVILGQDPYPAPDFATGRAFECGNVAAWRELDKMFSKSVRAFLQQICAARTGRQDCARSFADWPALLSDIEAGRIELEAPDALADRWVNSGTLLLNASLTLSRFRVETDPHQALGHLPVWQPLMVSVLERLAASGRPVVFMAFGDAAAACLRAAGLHDPQPPLQTIRRPHPAAAAAFLAQENPFLACNRFLADHGGRPIAW